MNQVAFLFPGQGAQYPGMGRDFFDSFREARETFEEADEILHCNLREVVFEGPESLLMETRYSQAGIFVNSVAILRTVLKQIPHLKCHVCAGLSLGEYSALFATGRIAFSECLELIQLRGQLLSDACEMTEGTMAAVLGLSAEEVESIINELNPPHLIWTANYNCPGQTVISGTCEAVSQATETLKTKGAKRVIPLQVQGAFHSGLMQSAQDRFVPAVSRSNIRESSVPLVMNVVGNYVEKSDEIKENLIQQVTHSVRWEQGIRSMVKNHVDTFIEMGCGKTLSGMNKKILDLSPGTFSVGKVADLDALASVKR